MAKRSCDPTSGSIARETYLLGRNGQVVRERVTPLNPQTAAQMRQRSTLGNTATSWRGLTDAQRLAWTTAAAGFNTKPRLGQSGPMTGEQLFCKINASLATFGIDTVTEPPAYPAFPALATTAMVVTNVNDVATIKLTAPTSPGEYTIIRGAAPCSAGIARLPRLSLLGTCPPPVTGQSDITTLYSAKFGNPVAGSRIFIVVSQLLDGWESARTQFTGIVPPTA